MSVDEIRLIEVYPIEDCPAEVSAGAPGWPSCPPHMRVMPTYLLPWG
jgi:hypothetical protein